MAHGLFVGGGTSAVTYDFTSGTAVVVIPTAVTTLTLELWGAGGGSGLLGGGGGAGGYSRSQFTVTSNAGQTINYQIGNAGNDGPDIFTSASPGGASQVTSGTFSLTTMTCNGGTGGGSFNAGGFAGSGGTATGGSQANTTGANGTAGTPGSPAAGTVGNNSNSAGAGRQNGRAIFTFV
jgi:hypothetical protein